MRNGDGSRCNGPAIPRLATGPIASISPGGSSIRQCFRRLDLGVHVDERQLVGSQEQRERTVQHHRRLPPPVQLANVDASRRVVADELDVLLLGHGPIAVTVIVHPVAGVVFVEARRTDQDRNGREKGNRCKNLAASKRPVDYIASVQRVDGL